MHTNISKRNLVRIISFGTAALLVLIGCIVKEKQMVNNLSRQINHTYSAALTDLSEDLNDISLMLEKCAYTGTSYHLADISSRLIKDTADAKSALSALPSSASRLQNINRFLSQVGDYSFSVTKKSFAEPSIDTTDRENLVSLIPVAKSLSQSVETIASEYASGEQWNAEIEQSLMAADSQNDDSFSSSMTEIDGSFEEYPSLVYDGPYSDHILSKTPIMTEGQPEVSREGARQVAAEIAAVDLNSVSDDSDEAGKMPSYVFKANDTVVSVTKKGGFPVYFRRYRDIGDYTLSYEEALEKAREFVNANTQYTFKDTYYFADEGMCVVNFAYFKDGVTYYTDLVKVGIALDNGEPIFFEARGFIVNHTERTLPSTYKTAEEARKVLSPMLTVENTELAVIPSSGQYETFCYEFVCNGLDGRDVLVYINAETLKEEDVLILLKADGGTLTK